MGESMEQPTTQLSPPPQPTPSFSCLLSKIALNASRIELLVLALVILFFASQVFLLVWVLRIRAGRYVAPPRDKEHRKVAIVLPAETNTHSLDTADAHDGDVAIRSSGSTGKTKAILRHRRRSSWGGRSAHPGSDETQERRRSEGLLGGIQDDSDDDDLYDDEERDVGAQASLDSSPDASPEPDADLEDGHGSALAALGDVGRIAAGLVVPATLPLPPSGGDEGTENADLKEPDTGQACDGLDLLVEAPIEKPPSPRSPRVLAADQAAMMDALCAEGKQETRDFLEADAPSPVVGAEVDAPALAFGFEDPLGANRMLDLSGKEEGDHEAVELEPRDGGRRDVGG